METIRPTTQGVYKIIEEQSGYFNLALGNITMFTVGVIKLGHDRIFIGVEGKGAYSFAAFAHWTYVAEKLRLNEADARNLSDFINTQILPPGSFEIQGKYTTFCCQT